MRPFAAALRVARAVDRVPPAPYVLGCGLIDLLLLVDRTPPGPYGVTLENGRWEPGYRLARGLRHVSAAALVREVEAAVQRVTRGWADRDAFDVGAHLARVSGEMLLHLAEVTRGWPDALYDSYEEWQDALRHHGRVLLASDADDPGAQDPEAVAASLRWVAEHHVQLWD